MATVIVPLDVERIQYRMQEMRLWLVKTHLTLAFHL
jgi:hypothetical protein